MIKPVGEQISPGCSTAGLLRAFNSLTHKTSMGGRASCCINACKNTLWKPIMTPGSSQHRGVHKRVGMHGHPTVGMAPSEPPPAPLPAHAKQEPASGPMHLPSPLPGRPWHRATQLLPSPPSSHYIKDNSLAILSKTVSTAIPIAHSALGLRYFFVKVSPLATGYVYLFIVCHPPLPMATSAP